MTSVRFGRLKLSLRGSSAVAGERVTPSQAVLLLKEELRRTSGVPAEGRELLRELRQRSPFGEGRDAAETLLKACERGDLLVALGATSAVAAGGGQLPAQPEPERPAYEKQEVKPDDAFVHLTVVDDETGDPLSDLAMTLELRPSSGAGAVVRKVTTDAQGVVHLPSVPRGECSVRTVTSGLTLADVFHVAGFGSSTLGPRLAVGHCAWLDGACGPRALAKVTFHRVRDEETLDSIAFFYGIPLKELCEFNFGSSDPKKVREGAAVVVGCSRELADGAPAFSEQDVPGYLAIPRSARIKPVAFSTDRREIMRLRNYDNDPYWLRVMDHDGSPVAKTLCSIAVGTHCYHGTTDNDGWLRLPFGERPPPEGVLRWNTGDGERSRRVLFPSSDEQPVAKARLHNLGYTALVPHALTLFQYTMESTCPELGEQSPVPEDVLADIEKQWHGARGANDEAA